MNPACVARKNPSQPGDRQHCNRCETPATIDFTGTPRFCQDEQRRNDRDKEQNPIQIHGGNVHQIESEY